MLNRMSPLVFPTLHPKKVCLQLKSPIRIESGYKLVICLKFSMFGLISGGLWLLLYTDDFVLIAESRLDLQNSLDSVPYYCQLYQN